MGCDYGRFVYYYYVLVKNECLWKVWLCQIVLDCEDGKYMVCIGECFFMGYFVDKIK